MHSTQLASSGGRMDGGCRTVGRRTPSTHSASCSYPPHLRSFVHGRRRSRRRACSLSLVGAFQNGRRQIESEQKGGRKRGSQRPSDRRPGLMNSSLRACCACVQRQTNMCVRTARRAGRRTAASLPSLPSSLAPPYIVRTRLG